MNSDQLQLGFHILDRQLIDSEGRRCGRVDDIEIDTSGEDWTVDWILVGAAAWEYRLPRPIGRMVARIFGGGEKRVAFDEVRLEGNQIRLTSPARELGLGRGDEIASRVIRRLPFS